MRRPPAILLVLAVVGAALFVLPLIGLLGVTPWTDLGSLLTDDVVVDALRLSLITSVAAALCATLLGVPLAWVLSRVDFRGRSLLRAIVTLPMVLPPVVGGAALLRNIEKLVKEFKTHRCALDFDYSFIAEG